MFENVGGKIKAIAATLTVIGIILSIIIGLLLIATYASATTIIIGLIIMGVGSLISWLSSLKLYAFGQLVENSDIIAKHISTNNTHFNNNQNKSFAYMQSEYKAEHRWRCPSCGNMISSNFCPYCGTASETGIQKLESINLCANCGYNTTYQNNCPNCGSSLKATKHFNSSGICTICGKENIAVQPVMLYKKGGKAYFECACNECITECTQKPYTIPTKIENKIKQLTLNNQLLHNLSDEENQWMCMACGRTLPFTQDRCSCGYKREN